MQILILIVYDMVDGAPTTEGRYDHTLVAILYILNQAGINEIFIIIYIFHNILKRKINILY